jgi:D-lactate dehydrogenase
VPRGVLHSRSRGFKDAAATKGAEMEAALLKASDNGKIPIVIDTSPCLAQVSDYHRSG